MTQVIEIHKNPSNGSIFIGKLNSKGQWTGFGQGSYSDGRKIQGSFRDGKVNGLALKIKPEGSAEFGKFKKGVKVEEIQDDETMYIYDDMYNEFKEACGEQGVEYFKWIEKDEDQIESESGLPEEEEDIEGIEIEDCDVEDKNKPHKIETDHEDPGPESDFEENLRRKDEQTPLGFSSMIIEPKKPHAKGEEEFMEDRITEEESGSKVHKSEVVEELADEPALNQPVEADQDYLSRGSPGIVKKQEGEDVQVLINKKNPKRISARKRKRTSPTRYDEFYIGNLPEANVKTLTPAKRILSTGEVITPMLDNVNKREAKSYKFRPSNNDDYLDPRVPSEIPIDVYLDILSRENHILNYYKSYLERNPRLARSFLNKFKGIQKMRNLQARGDNALPRGLGMDFSADDLKTLKEKYGLAALGELEKLGWSKRDLDNWNRKYGRGDPMSEETRKKLWAFNTNFRDLYDKILKDKNGRRGQSLEKKARKLLELGERNQKLKEELQSNLDKKDGDGNGQSGKKKRLRVQFASKNPNSQYGDSGKRKKRKGSPKKKRRRGGNGKRNQPEDDEEEKLRNKDFVYFNRKYFSGSTPERDGDDLEDDSDRFNNGSKRLNPYPSQGKPKEYSKYLEYAYPGSPERGVKQFDPYPSTTKGTSTKKDEKPEVHPLEFFLSKSPYDSDPENDYYGSKTDRGPRASPYSRKHPQTSRKKPRRKKKIKNGSVDGRTYSPFLYHPADYFHKKGRHNKSQYKGSTGNFHPTIKRGVLSNFNKSKSGVVNLSPVRKKGLDEFMTGQGPWYPGGDNLMYHNERVENWRYSSPERVKKFKVAY